MDPPPPLPSSLKSDTIQGFYHYVAIPVPTHTLSSRDLIHSLNYPLSSKFIQNYSKLSFPFQIPISNCLLDTFIWKSQRYSRLCVSKFKLTIDYSPKSLNSIPYEIPIQLGSPPTQSSNYAELFYNSLDSSSLISHI